MPGKEARRREPDIPGARKSPRLPNDPVEEAAGELAAARKHAPAISAGRSVLPMTTRFARLFRTTSSTLSGNSPNSFGIAR